MLTLEQNIRAVIETCFSESREDLQEIATQQIIGLIEANASNTLGTHWIPCEEQLPNSQVEVIVSIYDDSGDSAFDYTACGWVIPKREYWVVDNEINYNVVAWMPLPKPYKENEQ